MSRQFHRRMASQRRPRYHRRTKKRDLRFTAMAKKARSVVVVGQSAKEIDECGRYSRGRHSSSAGVTGNVLHPAKRILLIAAVVAAFMSPVWAFAQVACVPAAGQVGGVIECFHLTDT